MSDDLHSRWSMAVPCHSSSRATSEDPSIVCSEPIQGIFRRMTAPEFSEGTVFEVDPTMAKSIGLASRFILVIGRSGSSVVCLTLRRHEDLRARSQEFLRARVPLYTKMKTDDIQGQRNPQHFQHCPCAPLALEVEEGRTLSENVWINLAEPQTIRCAQKFEVEHHGALDDDSLARLKLAYKATQACMLESWQERPSVLMSHLFILWCYLLFLVEWLSR